MQVQRAGGERGRGGAREQVLARPEPCHQPRQPGLQALLSGLVHSESLRLQNPTKMTH